MYKFKDYTKDRNSKCYCTYANTTQGLVYLCIHYKEIHINIAQGLWNVNAQQ